MFSFTLLISTLVINSIGQRIGIIGGGVSGIAVSRLLREGGYHDISIFEREHELVPDTLTYRFDSDGDGAVTTADRGHDMTRIFFNKRTLVPGDRNDFVGLFSKLEDIVNDITGKLGVKVDMMPVNNSFFDQETLAVSTVNMLARFPTAQIISDLIEGIELLREVDAKAPTIKDVYLQGFCVKGESITEFGVRRNMPALAAFLTLLANGVNDFDITNVDNDGADHSCSYMLNNNKINIDLLAEELIHLGINSQSPEVAGPTYVFTRKVLVTKKEDCRLGLYNGHRQLFELAAKIEEMNGVNIQTSAAVENMLALSNGQVKLFVKQNGVVKEKVFDVVFSTVPPAEVAKFTDNDDFHPVFNLFNKAASQAGAIASILYHIVPLNTPFSFATITSPIAGADKRSFPGFAESALAVNCFPLRFYRAFFDMDLFTVQSLLGRTPKGPVGALDFQDLKECILHQLNALQSSFGFTTLTTDEIIMEAQAINSPSIVSTKLESEGWYGTLDSLQGVKGAYFFGETLSGKNLESILRFHDQAIKALFPKLKQIKKNLHDNLAKEAPMNASSGSGLNEITYAEVAVLIFCIVACVLSIVFYFRARKITKMTIDRVSENIQEETKV